MKNNAMKQYNEMINELKMEGIKPELKLALNGKPAKAIEEHIKNEGSDLLIVGARGRANGAGVLLGSITEKLIQTVSIPVLAVKKKGAGLGILDAILNT
jgi:nucleotide-binding universal stress UspA family protein